MAGLDELHERGDPLARLDTVVDWTVFAPILSRLPKADPNGPGGRPSFGSRLISKVLVILSLYGPGASQYITGDPADPLVKYFVDFAGTQAAELLRSCKLSRGSVSEVFPAHALKPLFDEPIQAGSRGNRLPREDDFDLVNPGRNPHRQPFSHAARHDRLRGCPTS